MLDGLQISHSSNSFFNHEILLAAGTENNTIQDQYNNGHEINFV